MSLILPHARHVAKLLLRDASDEAPASRGSGVSARLADSRSESFVAWVTRLEPRDQTNPPCLPVSRY